MIFILCVSWALNVYLFAMYKMEKDLHQTWYDMAFATMEKWEADSEKIKDIIFELERKVEK